MEGGLYCENWVEVQSAHGHGGSESLAKNAPPLKDGRERDWSHPWCVVQCWVRATRDHRKHRCSGGRCGTAGELVLVTLTSLLGVPGSKSRLLLVCTLGGSE